MSPVQSLLGHVVLGVGVLLHEELHEIQLHPLLHPDVLTDLIQQLIRQPLVIHGGRVTGRRGGWWGVEPVSVKLGG